MKKSELEEALRSFKANKNASYLCEVLISQEFYRKHRLELKSLACEFIKRSKFKSRFKVGSSGVFLFFMTRRDVDDKDIRNVRIVFLNWLIKRTQ